MPGAREPAAKSIGGTLSHGPGTPGESWGPGDDPLVAMPADYESALVEIARLRRIAEQQRKVIQGFNLAAFGQGGAEGPDADKVFLSVEGSPVPIIGEHVEEAAPDGKGPALDAITSACEPAATNTPMRNDPNPNQGCPNAQGNISFGAQRVVNTGTPNPVTTPAYTAEAENKVEWQHSNNQQSENAGSLEPGSCLAPPGKENSPSVTTPIVAAPPPFFGIQAQQSQKQVAPKEGEETESPEIGKVLIPIEGSPVENIGEEIEKATSKGKGPPLDAIPSGREPAADNIPKRNDPCSNQGGLEAQGNNGINESDKDVSVCSESFELFGCDDKMP